MLTPACEEETINIVGFCRRVFAALVFNYNSMVVLASRMSTSAAAYTVSQILRFQTVAPKG